jgi:hypothetical protein
LKIKGLDEILNEVQYGNDEKLVNESDVICMMHASYIDNPKWS